MQVERASRRGSYSSEIFGVFRYDHIAQPSPRIAPSNPTHWPPSGKAIYSVGGTVRIAG